MVTDRWLARTRKWLARYFRLAQETRKEKVTVKFRRKSICCGQTPSSLTKESNSSVVSCQLGYSPSSFLLFLFLLSSFLRIPRKIRITAVVKRLSQIAIQVIWLPLYSQEKTHSSLRDDRVQGSYQSLISCNFQQILTYFKLWKQNELQISSLVFFEYSWEYLRRLYGPVSAWKCVWYNWGIFEIIRVCVRKETLVKIFAYVVFSKALVNFLIHESR